MSERNETEYSKKIPGDRRNYRMAVRFDDSDGYLRIQQEAGEDGSPPESLVLLSPNQVEVLIAFYRKWHPATKRAKAHA